MTMIMITSTNGEQKLFKDYNDVCNHINNIERRKSGGMIWRFIRRKYETLLPLFYHTPSLEKFLTPKEKEAVEKEVGLIEIVKGNRKHVTQLLFTSRLDLEPLKRDWCKDYCAERGFKLCELVVEKT